jgi:hypothetical protein
MPKTLLRNDARSGKIESSFSLAIENYLSKVIFDFEHSNDTHNLSK